MIETADYTSISHSFASELKAAWQSEPSSIPFIRNPLPEHSLVQPGQIFQVFVIGGTNGAMATASVDQSHAIVIRNQIDFTPLPRFATVDDFLSFIRTNLDPQSTALGINFAYNLIPVVGEHGELDGIMNQGDTKGHAFKGLQQRRVGETIAKDLKEKLGRDITVSVANDTVCLITSGLEEGIDRQILVAIIAGTGYNDAIFLDDHTVINLQASDFTGFVQTATGKAVDATSNNPGEQLYNKEVAAGDLYKHFNLLIQHLNLQVSPLQSSEELSELAKSKNGVAAEVAKELFARSARLVAAHLAGIYQFKGRPEQLLCIMQGSLLIKESGYLEIIQQELEKLGIPANTIHFKKVENSDILGAIKLLT